MPCVVDAVAGGAASNAPRSAGTSPLGTPCEAGGNVPAHPGSGTEALLHGPVADATPGSASRRESSGLAASAASPAPIPAARSSSSRADPPDPAVNSAGSGHTPAAENTVSWLCTPGADRDSPKLKWGSTGRTSHRPAAMMHVTW